MIEDDPTLKELSFPQFIQEHVWTNQCIFTTLAPLFFITRNRAVVVSALEAAKELFVLSPNHFKDVPKSLVQRWITLLYVPRLGPDSLEYMDPLHHVVSRVSTLKLMVGYDATVDPDVRDRALDVLALYAAEYMNDVDKWLHKTQGLMPLCHRILPILTTKVGRNDASALAIQLLQHLAPQQDPKFQEGFLAMQDSLVFMSSRGDASAVAKLLNDLYPSPARRRRLKEQQQQQEEGEEGKNSGEDRNKSFLD